MKIHTLFFNTRGMTSVRRCGETQLCPESRSFTVPSKGRTVKKNPTFGPADDCNGVKIIPSQLFSFSHVTAKDDGTYF